VHGVGANEDEVGSASFEILGSLDHTPSSLIPAAGGFAIVE
jgi:hypothetical protein